MFLTNNEEMQIGQSSVERGPVINNEAVSLFLDISEYKICADYGSTKTGIEIPSRVLQSRTIL